MANITKQKRDQMLAFLEELKKEHADDTSIRAFNEIENHIKEKKFGLVFEEHTEEVEKILVDNIPVFVSDESRRICKDKTKAWNFLIEGDNLQALYLLEKTHQGRVDCIYIDPPYNTGAKDWKYNNDYVDSNDVYRHSKWLSMMKSRLCLAQKLLNPKDSVLIVTIDEKEYLHLGCLLEEMFPTARIQMISSVINPSGSARKNLFSRAEEYIFFVFIGDAHVYAGREDMIHPVKEDLQVRWASLLRSGSNSNRSARPNLFYPVFFRKDDGKFYGVGDSLPLETSKETVQIPEECFAVWPMKANGQEARWTLAQSTLLELKDRGLVKFGSWTKGQKTRTISYLADGMQKALEKGELEILGRDEEGALITGRSYKTIVPLTVWNKPSHGAGDYGSSLLLDIFKSKRFTFPKSLYAVKDTLGFIVKGKKDAIIVDFFAGSGTTLHAVNLLNAEDGGNRTCILCTNNEVSEEEAKSLKQSGFNKGDEEWENLGIAKYVTWPRILCSIEGVDINGKKLDGTYLETDIAMSDGFIENVKYFKCDWTPRKPEDYLLSNALCLHIKEMIELQNAIEVDGIKNVLLLNKDDIKRNILDPLMYEKAERIWLNQSIILNSEEMKLLKNKGFKYIPREFFGQELREVAE